MIWTDNFFLILITTLTAAISLLIWRAIRSRFVVGRWGQFGLYAALRSAVYVCI